MPMLSGTDRDYKASDTYMKCALTRWFRCRKDAPLDSGNDRQGVGSSGCLCLSFRWLWRAVYCGIFCAQMKTASEQTHANAYMPAEGSGGFRKEAAAGLRNFSLWLWEMFCCLGVL